MASLTLHGVRKEYGQVVALDSLDLDVRDGEFFVLLGPSGAGKTTTLKCVAGLEGLSAGRVEIGGRDVTDAEPNSRHVAMAFENYALYPQYTVYDNIAFPLRSPRYRVSAQEATSRIDRVTTTLGINQLLERAPRELSGGQRQRVALARVLVRPADVLLLDEPLSHLDAKLRAAMRTELKSLGDLQHTTSLYVTHDYLEALALGDRIAVLREGKLVQVGTREEMWHQPVDLFVAQAFGQPRINLVLGEIVRTDRGQAFRDQDGAFVIPLGDVDVPAQRSVWLGLRPRDLVLGESTGMHPLQGRVYVVETLGRQLEVTVDVGAQRISLVVPRTEIEPDTMVTFSVPPHRLLLFDAASERRLEMAPAVGHQAGASHV